MVFKVAATIFVVGRASGKTACSKVGTASNFVQEFGMVEKTTGFWKRKTPGKI